MFSSNHPISTVYNICCLHNTFSHILLFPLLCNFFSNLFCQPLLVLNSRRPKAFAYLTALSVIIVPDIGSFLSCSNKISIKSPSSTYSYKHNLNNFLQWYWINILLCFKITLLLFTTIEELFGEYQILMPCLFSRFHYECPWKYSKIPIIQINWDQTWSGLLKIWITQRIR